jgi:hypothetical protein
MRILFIIIISALLIPSFAQNSTNTVLSESELELKEMFDRFYKVSDSINKEQLVDSILAEFSEALSTENSFAYEWRMLDKIGKINSEDQRMKVFTWHHHVDNEQYRYYGFIQLSLTKGRIRVFQLNDNMVDRYRHEKLDQSFENWHGKLYYSIIVNEHKRNTYYTLLGMDYNNSMSNLKTIETLTIKRNQPIFTKEMYSDGTDRKDRTVLEYSSRVAISVRYNSQLDQIVFDHLIPPHPVYSGNYEFYGPDGSYDGMEFENGIWIIRKDVDARNSY